MVPGVALVGVEAPDRGVVPGSGESPLQNLSSINIAAAAVVEVWTRMEVRWLTPTLALGGTRRCKVTRYGGGGARSDGGLLGKRDPAAGLAGAILFTSLFLARSRLACFLLLTAKPWEERQQIAWRAAKRKWRDEGHTHNPRPNCQLHGEWAALEFTIDAHS